MFEIADTICYILGWVTFFTGLGYFVRALVKKDNGMIVLTVLAMIFAMALLAATFGKRFGQDKAYQEAVGQGQFTLDGRDYSVKRLPVVGN